MTERYLVEMFLLGVVLAAIGVLSFFGWRSQRGWNNWTGATTRAIERTIATIAILGACFAIAQFLLNG